MPLRRAIRRVEPPEAGAAIFGADLVFQGLAEIEPFHDLILE